MKNAAICASEPLQTFNLTQISNLIRNEMEKKLQKENVKMLGKPYPCYLSYYTQVNSNN